MSNPGPVPESTDEREPDPRIERSRRLILTASLELLGELGYGGVTIEGVAARAGVGKSTIYRYWAGKLDLVEDALRVLKSDVALPAVGPVKDRVIALLQQAAVSLADSTWSRCLPALIDAAERDPEVLAIHRRLAGERCQLLVDLLAEGVGTGEVPPGSDLRLLAESLVGPIIIRRLLFQEAFDPAAVPGLVGQILD